MRTPEEGPRDSFRLQPLWQVGLIDELVEMRMSGGCEPPLSGAVVEAAAKRVRIRWVLELARRDGRWILARLLARYLITIRPDDTSRR